MQLFVATAPQKTQPRGRTVLAVLRLEYSLLEQLNKKMKSPIKRSIHML